jgi:hypothetical protein
MIMCRSAVGTPCPPASVALACALCTLLSGAATPAAADWGVPSQYTTLYWLPPGITQPVTLLVVPDGSGPPLTQARSLGGSLVDATVHVLARDDAGLPEPGVDAEGWNLVWTGGGVHACGGGLPADHATLADGTTEWAGPLRAGGHSHGLVRVFTWGNPVFTNDGQPLQVNSPDLNGDLEINLLDVPLFAQDFLGGTYDFRSDLHYDGVVNLSDIIPLAQHLGARCP